MVRRTSTAIAFSRWPSKVRCASCEDAATPSSGSAAKPVYFARSPEACGERRCLAKSCAAHTCAVRVDSDLRPVGAELSSDESVRPLSVSAHPRHQHMVRGGCDGRAALRSGCHSARELWLFTTDQE